MHVFGKLENSGNDCGFLSETKNNLIIFVPNFRGKKGRKEREKEKTVGNRQREWMGGRKERKNKSKSGKERKSENRESDKIVSTRASVLGKETLVPNPFYVKQRLLSYFQLTDDIRDIRSQAIC